MKKLLPILLPLFCSAQCDLELLEFDPVLGTVTVAFNNTENCGGAGAPDGVSELQFGFQAIDEDCNAMNIGWDFPSFDFSLSSTSNHPGWVYSATTTESPTNWVNLYDESLVPPYYAGDTVTFPLWNPYQADCVDGPTANQMYCNLEDVITYWYTEGYSIQAVIWQISYGQTMYAADGGWAEVGVNGDGTSWGSGLYEDSNFLDNWVVVGDCGDPIPEVVTDTIYIELPPDTVYQTLTLYDTITVPINWYFYDTTYVYLTDTLVEYVELPQDTLYITLSDTLYLTDTLYFTEYVYDTTYVYLNDTTFVYDTTYVYQVDTLYEYIVQEIWIDCNTGLPCIEQPPGIDEDQVVYVPNAFSPNNDGINDAFFAVTQDPNFWLEWNITVFSRWGDVVFQSDSPLDKWDGSVSKGSYYSPDGVYSWIINAKGRKGVAVKLKGSVTLVR